MTKTAALPNISTPNQEANMTQRPPHWSPETLEQLEALGDAHLTSSLETPMRPDAWELSPETKIERIEQHFAEIMHIIGLDLTDDSLQGTPRRVAKMLVQEVFAGLNPDNHPDAKLFENKFRYQEMLVEKNITFKSFCEHHFLPVVGQAHVAYIAQNGVIGLSKINRIVDFYARRPQVQERMTRQIAEELQNVLETEDVAVLAEAKHFCVLMRGIEDHTSTTVTAEYRGVFQTDTKRQEFLQYVQTDLMSAR
jgi:GTP cyclohydrolase I